MKIRSPDPTITTSGNHMQNSGLLDLQTMMLKYRHRKSLFLWLKSFLNQAGNKKPAVLLKRKTAGLNKIIIA